MTDIEIRGTTTHNLKCVDVDVPKHQMVAFTGVSGSGKSSLVFDTIYTEAQRQLVETFSTYARRRLPQLTRPPVDEIRNISPCIVIDQKRLGASSRSTVGTATEIYTYMRMLFSRCGRPFIGWSHLFSFNHPEGICPACKGLGKRITVDIDRLLDRTKSIAEGAILPFASSPRSDESPECHRTRPPRIVMLEGLVEEPARRASVHCDQMCDRTPEGKRVADTQESDLADDGSPGAEHSNESGAPVEEHLSHGRAVGVWVLIVVATLIGVLASTNVWVQRQALDTDNFVNASDELLENDEVRAALSEYLVNELYAEVDVEAELAEKLPEDLQGLAGPAAAALRGPATDGVETLMTTSEFQSLWSEITRAAHTVLVGIVEDDGTVIDTSGGVVTLQLGELLVQVGEKVGISDDALTKIPDDAGSVVIARSAQLNELQNGVKVIEWVSAFALVLVVALYALAVYLATGMHRVTLRNVGWAIFFWGLVLLVLRRVGINYLVDQLDDPAVKPAANATFGIESELLAQLGWIVVLSGVIVVLAALLAGPSAPATSVRRFLAPTLNGAPGLVWGGAAIIFFLLLLWSPTPAFEQWYTVLILAALFAGGVGALRAQTQREFPDVPLGERSDDLVPSVPDTGSDA